MTWAPLHVHSQYSILDSTASVTALAEQAKAYGLKYLALTDRGNLYGAVDFFKACKSSGIKPILGCEIWMAPGSRLEKRAQSGGFPLILLVKSQKGYQNLCALSSSGFLEGFYYEPRIDRELLKKHAEGLICLLGREVPDLLWFKELFGADLYLELQRQAVDPEKLREDGVDQEGWLVQMLTDTAEQQARTNARLLELSKEHGVPLVATHSVHYLERSDWKAHEILLNVQSGETCEIWERDSRGGIKGRIPNPKRKVAQSHEFYFRSPKEMAQIFSDLPEVLEESARIAEKCTFAFDFQTKHYPSYDAPQGAAQFLRELCEAAIPTRYPPERLVHVAKRYPGRDPLEVVRERFEYEFHILNSKGMCDYLLIVYDFIAWAKRNGIPMGPGRGSAAGSVISFLTGITDIEPLRFQLFFERFINPERISYPDIDVDICMERRQEVIDYTVGKYGKERVAQIITFGTMKAKMALRDVGRVLNMPLPRVNEIVALVPEELGITIEKALQMDPELQRMMENDEDARRLLEIAQKAEGSIRNTSTHAAGLIISKDPLTENVPVCTAKDSQMLVTQYAMKPVESIGMLKIDFLGLKTLTSLQKCCEAIGGGVDWTTLPLEDPKTFELLRQGKTEGVFQLESGGMTDLVQQLRIDNFEEIIAVVALYRPGPMELIPSYIERKHGREAIEIDHPLMQQILSETYGIMVYQEQVMQIASVLAGYSLGEGDVLRRAMGKKDREEMARQREKFVAGAQVKNLSAELAGTIFDKIEKFASYGFNKSHAAAYAYLSYATAYFKANYPREWMAALMTCDRDHVELVAKWVGEARSLGIPVLSPHINFSDNIFVATSEGIRYALSGIKGLGTGAVDLMLAERKAHGPYQSPYDLIQRADKTRVGKKSFELLIDAGALDGMGWSRDALRESLEAMFQQASRDQKEASLGVLNLFSLIDSSQERPFASPPPILNPSAPKELLRLEKERLGFYLTGHPLDDYLPMMKTLAAVPLAELSRLPEGAPARIVCIIDEVQTRISAKTQKKFAILQISDRENGRMELPIWADLYEEKAALLKEGQLLYAGVHVERRGDALQIQCRLLGDLTTVDAAQMELCKNFVDKGRTVKKERKVEKEAASKLQITLDADRVHLSDILALKKCFRAHPGPSPIGLHFQADGRIVGSVQIDASWGVKLGRELHGQLDPLLSRLKGKIDVQ